ncbi:MAG: S1/P1 Nuclease [Marinilabiliales bacterium]|nr:MAG: S1/P1 Nuclease [Marinilabiliales bacterium]
MNKIFRISIFIFLMTALPLSSFSWGFYCHRLINKHAVFLLPPEMVGFYKKNIEYLIQHSVDPDKRSHAVEGEAEKHYIDIDVYGDNPFEVVPKQWRDAVKKYGEDTLHEFGILPWNIQNMYYRLVDAFKEGDVDRILNVSANFGHYIGDCHVPLHTTQYYDGRVLYQKGIHALWETRIPELMAEDWDFFLGRAEYVPNALDKAWDLVEISHNEVDSVINMYDSLFLNYDQDAIFVMEERGATLKRQYSLVFCNMFEQTMDDMVNRKLRMSVYWVASFWYSAWVDAGQPDLDRLMDKEVTKAHKEELKELDKMWRSGKVKHRPNPEDSEE